MNFENVDRMSFVLVPLYSSQFLDFSLQLSFVIFNDNEIDKLVCSQINIHMSLHSSVGKALQR